MATCTVRGSELLVERLLARARQTQLDRLTEEWQDVSILSRDRKTIPHRVWRAGAPREDETEKDGVELGRDILTARVTKKDSAQVRRSNSGTTS
jgi:hypothetical protein